MYRAIQRFSMTSPAVAGKFADIITPPPALDVAMLLVGDDLKQFERQVDQFETAMLQWRATLLPKLPPALDEMKRMRPTASDVEANVLVAIKTVEDGIAVLSTPMHGNPAISDRIDQISRVSNSAGKFVRKLMRRIERIRVAQHAFYVDIYYGLLAVKSEMEKGPEQDRSFSDPAELGAFLRSRIA